MTTKDINLVEIVFIKNFKDYRKDEYLFVNGKDGYYLMREIEVANLVDLAPFDSHKRLKLTKIDKD